jgi:predicted transcriptional regulator
MSYVTIQDWMLEYGLPTRETVLYAIIYGFSQDGESKCFATQEYLCRWMQCTTPTLHKALNALIERGIIVKEQPNPHGKCAYIAVDRYKETLHQCKETLHRGYKETLPNNKDTDIKINKNINGEKPDFEQEFAAVWELYPRKEGRQRAQVAYIAARRKGVSAETIRDGVERYAAQVKAEQTPPQYIKQGGNWFASHRWEDQHTPPKPKPTDRRALKYMQGETYTADSLKKMGVSLGEEFYE